MWSAAILDFASHHKSCATTRNKIFFMTQSCATFIKHGRPWNTRTTNKSSLNLIRGTQTRGDETGRTRDPKPRVAVWLNNFALFGLVETACHYQIINGLGGSSKIQPKKKIIPRDYRIFLVSKPLTNMITQRFLLSVLKKRETSIQYGSQSRQIINN